MERRTGLLRCYTSRVENGFTVPSPETLEKYAKALEIPLYQLFTNGRRVKHPVLRNVGIADHAGGSNGVGPGEIRAFRKALSRMDDRKRKLLLSIAARLAARSRKRRSRPSAR